MWKRLLCASVLVMSVGGVAIPQAFAADPNPGCPSDPEAAGVALQNSVQLANANAGTTIELTAVGIVNLGNELNVLGALVSFLETKSRELLAAC